MTTNVNKLYFNFLSDEMISDNSNSSNRVLYATTDASGSMSNSQTVFTLATISSTSTNIGSDCTYKYKITATVANPITDGSGDNIFLNVNNKNYTLSEILQSGESGIIYTGKVFNVKNGNSKTITTTAFIENVYKEQDDLKNNKFSFKIQPYSENGKSAISCKTHYTFDDNETFANNLIKSDKLWQSGLEGDGYRYTATALDEVNNIVCLDMNSKEACLSSADNMKKYLFQIIGVFPDSSGNQYVKLVKAFTENVAFDYSSDLSKIWNDTSILSTLKQAFLSTSYYSDSTKDKIATWKWKTLNASKDLNLDGISAKDIYSYEMLGNSTIDNEATRSEVESKIGLMYISDYVLSYGDLNKSKAYGGDADYGDFYYLPEFSQISGLSTYYISRKYNIESYPYDIFITKYSNGFVFSGFSVFSTYYWPVSDSSFSSPFPMRPVIYLNSDVKASGDGTLDDPYIIK